MATVAMQKIRIYALQKDRKQVLEAVQRMGVLEVAGSGVTDPFYTVTDPSASLSQFDHSMETAKKALEILDEISPRKKSMFSSLYGRKRISGKDFDSLADRQEQILSQAQKLVRLSRDIAEKRAKASRLAIQAESLTAWLSLDVPLQCNGTRTSRAFIGTLPEEYTLESLLESLSRRAPEADPVYAEIVSASREQTCIFLLCPCRLAGLVEQALREMGFSHPSDLTKNPPAVSVEQLMQRQKSLLEEAEAIEKTIAEQRGAAEDFEFLLDFYAMRREKYQVIGTLAQTKHAFVLTGYLPKEAVPSLEQRLKPYGAVVEQVAWEKGETPPVLLRNNRFAEPVEGIVEMYSLPSKRDIDPTFITSIFYYFLFGMMLADAAYGIIMVAGCWIALKKFPHMSIGLKRTLKMFLYSGISTTIWGVLFGSYFGDAVAIAAKTFFGVDFTIPALWFVPLDDPMRMLMVSFAIGLVHLFAGLGVQLYQLCRARDWKGALFDVGFWYFLLIGLIVWLLSTEMFQNMAGLQIAVPASLVSAAQILAAAGALGIILTAGRESRSPFKRLLKGAYGLYGVTSYLSDILSYSRLLALGLATGVIGSVINTMGTMVGGGAAGVIVFILVFLVGHTFNIAINLLGAYVHTNRLQYVEFFGKFYEGGGRKYSPFAANTQYLTIKEEKEKWNT